MKAKKGKVSATDKIYRMITRIHYDIAEISQFHYSYKKEISSLQSVVEQFIPPDIGHIAGRMREFGMRLNRIEETQGAILNKLTQLAGQP